MAWLNRYADAIYCIVRLTIGLMFACHGGVTVGWIELSCGFLIGFGLLTRLAAFIASGEMAVAYFLTSFSGKVIGHAPTALERFLPILNKGELPVLFCFIFFFTVFYGPGRWSIDALMGKRSTSLS